MKVSPSLIISTLLLTVFLILSPLTLLAQTAGVRARVTQPVDMQNLVTLPGNVHPLARPEFEQGVAPDDLPMERMLLVLQRGTEQESALRQLLDDQQVKSSPRFHQWLTPEQFGQQFGPADSDLQAVTDWLTAQGFEVTRVSAGRTAIEFSGTAGLVRQVLGTEIHRFRVNGQDHWANASDPQIPAALAPVVAGFASLNNFPRKPLYQSLGTFSRSKVTGEVQPLFTFPVSCSGGSGTCYWFALGPTDFATIYNVLPLWNAATPTDGTGQTIAVVGETNINPQDVTDFRAMFGLPANPPNIILNGPDPGIQYDEDEADLDVQWSGAVAKGATIDFVVSETTEATPGIDLSALYIIDNNLAPVMSESYGACEAELGAAGNQFHSTLWEQAAAQGITVLMAAGDSGSAACDRVAGETAAQYGLMVSGLASTPFNVAVGGTDFNDVSDPTTYWSLTNNSFQSSAKSYIPESTWNDSCAASGLLGCASASSTSNFSEGFDLVAGSGGPSNCTTPSGTFPNVTCSGKYAKPSWQSGTGVPPDGARDIPDVSLFAGNGMNGSFYVTCQMDANASSGGSSSSCDLNAPYLDFQGGSGTSASVQTLAGIMAMVNQAHGRQGNANYVLYPMAAKSGASCNSSTAPVTNSSCIFYDVTVGNNSVICQGGSPSCSNTNTASGQYGIMDSGGSPAYATTLGYDLATGLGSVNVANLVNNWTSNFTPSTTTLSLSTSPATNPITLTHGQPINYTINVAPGSGSGTPTGDASLIAQTSNSQNVSPTIGIGPFTLSGGIASGSTLMLPGGSYNVTAHYAGNGTFAASDSSPGIPVTVGKESSKTHVEVVSCNYTSGVCTSGVSSASGVSSYLILRIDVTNASGQPCASPATGSISYPCPTGTVTVTVNGQQPVDYGNPSDSIPGTYLLNSQGYAEDQYIALPGGTDSIVATYAGDNSYLASTSPVETFTLTLAPTTMSLSVQPTNTFASGATAFLSSYVYSHSNTFPLGGTVTYYMGNTPLSGTPSIFQDSSLMGYQGLQVSLNVPLTGLGTVTLTGQYSGDTHYAAATSPPLQVILTDYTVTPNPPSINISAPGQSGTATITLAPLNGFSGQVYLSAPSGCPVGASCTLSTLGYINVSSASSPTVTLTVATTAPTSASVPFPPSMGPPSLHLRGVWPPLMIGLWILAMFLSLALGRRRPMGWLLVSALSVVGIWIACGGGSGGGGGGGGSGPSLPSASITPPGLSFGQVNLGSTSVVQSMTLGSTGNASLSISGITLGGTNPGDFAQTNTCGTTLASGATCAINVTFTPTATGIRSASLTVNDNANSGTQTVGLTGQGAQPPTYINISEYSLEFSPEYIGSTSAGQSVIFSNTGNFPVSLSSIALTGTNPGDFGQTSNCGNTIAPEANCTVTVTFKPTAAGIRSAYLMFTDNAGDYNTNEVFLSGTGVQPSSTVAITPGSLTFPVQNENTISPPQSVTLTNSGSTPLSITLIDTEGPTYYDFSETNNCGSTVAAGGSCTINVKFCPIGIGSRLASLCVYDLPAGNEQVVNLNGTAVPPATPPGTYTVTVQASSNGDVHLLNIPVTVQ